MTDTEKEPQEPAAPAATPAAAGESTGHDAPEPIGQGHESRLSTAALVTALVALLIGIGALTAGYFIWHEVARQADWQKEVIAQIDSRNQAMDQRLAQMKDRIEALLADSLQRDREFQQSLAKLAREQEALSSAFSRLRARLGRRLEGWILAEAQYLLEIANQRLRLFHDVATARAALREADRRITEADDPGLIPVREEIARELAALDAVSLPDVAGLGTRLSALAEQVDRLPIAGTSPGPASQTTGKTGANQSTSEARGWRALLNRVWQAFRELVSIQRTDAPVAPLLPPKERFFLRANLALELEAARLALLREQPALYRSSLDQARDWLSRYFDPEDAGVRAMIEAIDELQRVEVSPRLPDISGSLRLLRDHLRQLEGGDGEPGGTGSRP